MKKLFTFLLYAMMIIAVGCTESFDDSQIWDKINSLENRVAALEQLCKQMNTNISSLQTVVNALQNNDYVTNIAPITEDGKVIGYTITFSKSGTITIYHGKDGANGADGKDGKDGQDGYTPVIGIAKDTDGVYYWTLDGDWLLDKDGNKVKAEGKDGKNGVDGTTPKLKIEDGYWYISYDNGTTWTELGKATGEDGDSMFKEVTYDDEYVYFTLTDGTILTVPLVSVTTSIENTQIWYTSSTGNVVTPYDPDAFGVNIISNVYENGMGVITFDGKVTSIGKYAFLRCNYLKSITIPEGVISIEESAFHECKSLKSAIIPEGVTTIGDHAFYHCTSMTNITIPKSLTNIEDCAFFWCISLESITIPDKVTSIGESAFLGCKSLTSVNIPKSVTSIGNHAFNECSSLHAFYGENAAANNRLIIINGEVLACAPAELTSITIPDSVTSIGYGVFNTCPSLSAFYGKYASEDHNYLSINGELLAFVSAGLTAYTIPDSITSIGKYAFYECANLKSITIPNSVTSIGEYAFTRTSLTSITIPESVTSIENGTFLQCEALESATIPNSITSIGTNVFWGCKSLKDVFCKAMLPPVLINSASVFEQNSARRKIYVPSSSVSEYKSAEGWENYASDIVGYDFE